MSSEPLNNVSPQRDNYLETLLRLGQLLNSSLDLHHVLETAIEQVIGFVGAERGFILLVDVRHGKIWGEALRNIEKQGLEATLKGTDKSNRAEISKSIVEDVLKHHKPVLSHNAMEDPRFSERASVQLTHLRSVLCVPLVAQGKSLGIIYVDNRAKTGMFSEHHLSMLSAFANQASVAIENARLYDNLRR
ncbi:MAG: GAF domain-containing protein, partial [Armatimonadetes bacterium]|nr:GAF domain-containing protein [Armatimonadota bacterium]